MSGKDESVPMEVDGAFVVPQLPTFFTPTTQAVPIKKKSPFVEPKREVLRIFDVGKWHKSKAYKDYMDQLHRLNSSVRSLSTESEDIEISENVQSVIDLLFAIEDWMNQFPPINMEIQRFGNKSFRDWNAKVAENIDRMFTEILPKSLHSALPELKPYFMDAFGNTTRIDYGTGHEASFLMFILCLYKLGYFTEKHDDKGVVLRLFRQYISLIRHLQIVYRMEPAGSKGVHALDDFSFIPFIFGSSQLIENRLSLVPDSYVKADLPSHYADHNMFFEAIEYINNTKTGPFFEHSNQLWNISAVQTWEKVNSGLFKMYEAEVLKKFPVCQHFLFGNLFCIEERFNVGTPFNITNAKAPVL
uniref:Serine/threonine-protein phosphatase 2A activator n=1 Tax=Rhabditophanes sp. KR3021 TaxID=114890 RepID=A0AC35TXK7_9BILA